MDVYKVLPFNPRVDLELNEKDSTLTIADTGIGMNEEDLVSHLAFQEIKKGFESGSVRLARAIISG